MKLAWMVVASSLSCGLAQAGDDPSFVSGTWTGTGVFQVSDRITACPEVTMRFSASPASYNLAGASIKCGDMVRTEPLHPAYDIREDGQVYFHDVPVGRVDNDRIHIDNPVGAGSGMSDDYTIIRRGDLVVFTQVMGAPGAMPRFSFVAIMRRAAEPPRP
ncbi:conserved exported protein of unknown function [Rhodovastum atsumiense]|uniref:Lipocalin-like domain-containing protein n=1 Tax=Rhodovastum atsumiense TaxID=504468 RepID=A0A5M6IJE8_9PROT|nr:hypothetical protein [Rhodovastum atsumiense]KAA5608396.1 hypothetical protein F1189_29335 [Rhodovastum atsumiense]CAH2599955.1 conserved exported protein of unknown function [Rhodovastum atsumiense]